MKKSRSIWLWGLFFIYLLILLRITVFRPSLTLANFMKNGTINLTLFQDYIPLIQQGRWFRFIYLFVGNIVWFVPLGGILMLSGKAKKLRRAVLYGLALSLAIEIMQYLFGTGISELDDLVLNTFGTWIGAVMGQRLRIFHDRRNY